MEIIDSWGFITKKTEKDAASLRYRCPRVVLIVSRAQWEMGRTRFLISSAVTTIGVRTRGVLRGINLAKNWE